MTDAVHAGQLHDLARRLGALSADKRRLFVARLEERGIEIGVLPIVAGARPERIPLSYAQQRLWIADRLDPDAALYNLTTALRLRGPLDRAALGRALDGLVARHEALRTGFAEEAGAPYQVVHPAAPLPLAVVDLTGDPDPERRARELAAEDAARPFDLAAAPLLRATLVVLGDGDHRLILGMHHLISDEWSNAVLIEELIRLYDGDAALPPPVVHHADYALWQRAWLEGAAVRRQLAYWEAELGTGAYQLALPTDAPRAEVASSAGAAHRFALDRGLKDRLAQLARRCDATLFMTVLAGFQVVLARSAGQAEVRVGVPIANRHRPEIAGVVGFFSNTQVLRAVVRPADRVADHVRSVRRSVLDAQANQDLPFERLVDALEPERRAGGNPLFEVMLSWHREEATHHRLRDGVTIDWEVPEERFAKFDLCLHATDATDGIACELVYRRELFRGETIERLAARLAIVLDEMTRDSERPIAALGWLDRDERSAIAAWSAGEPQPAMPSVHGWLRDVALGRPDAVALTAGDEVVRYGELEARANRLAGRLIAAGVGLESRVAVALPRACDFVVALYAALKCGAAYVPLDPQLPTARLAGLLESCQAVIGAAELRDRVDAPIAWLMPDDRSDETPSDAVVSRAVSPDTAAYVMYTSGSTGQPKGVVVSHGNLASYADGVLARLALPDGASMAMVSTVAADLGNTTLFGALCSGATLHLISEADAFDADAMARMMTERAVEVLKIVPSHLRGALRAARPGDALPRHTLVLGGEATDWALVEQIATLGGCRIVNHYGPTETTVGVLTHAHDPTGRTAPRPTPRDLASPIDPTGGRAASATLPLGLPLPGRQVHVLDAQLAPVPPGVVGEIYIGGGGVARGYADQPALTADRFIPDRFGAPGGRLYRTGDRARRLADGRIEFLGRGDGQIKLRGHRIELGEIQQAVIAASGASAVEVLVTEGPAGAPQLTAYAIGEADPELRDRLAERLPAHMVPAEIVWLDRFPVTPNGKLDRKALVERRAEGWTGRAGAERVAPRNDIERALAQAWCDALGCDEVGVHDNFFQLGGDSLLAFQVIAAARAAGLQLSPRDLFERQTIARLAAKLEASASETAAEAATAPAAPTTAAGDAIEPIARDGALPASFAQERLWFLWRLDPESAAYHAPVALRMTGALDAARLEGALRGLADRHEILRTRLVEAGGAIHQVIDERCDTTIERATCEASAARELARRFAVRPFDLARGPLWRALLVDLAPGIGAGDHLLVVVFHHAVSDGWSNRVLVRELAALYAGDALPALPIQYADHAAWQRRWLAGGEQQRQLAYWRDRLGANPPVIELPADRARPAMPSGRGASLDVELGGALSAALIDLARAHDATPFMVLLAAFAAVLHRVTGQTDLRIGVPNANRHRREVDGLIGCFVNTQVLRVELAPRDGFAALLARVKAATLGALQHADLPFEQLVEALAPARSLSHSPLFQVMFNHQRRDAAAIDQLSGQLGGLDVVVLDLEPEVSAFDLTLDTWEDGGEVRGAITYATDLFDAPTVARLIDGYQRLLRAVCAAPAAPVGLIAMLSGDDHRALAELATGVFEPLDPHGLFDRVAAQAVRTPDAVAVQHAGATVSYAELDRRARRLAARLSRLGVGRDDLVGLCVDRSPRLVVGALGIVAAGGAYVPLDPDYPRDRLAYMLADARPRVLVTERPLAEQFADAARAAGAALCLLDHDDDDDPGAGDPALRPARPEQLAYCIYTSGSTGRPKGVGISHAAIGNFLDAMQRELPLTSADRVLAITPISFDIAGLELFLPLVAGARVVIADRDEAMDPTRLLARVRYDGVTLVQATPSTWRMVAGHPRAADSLRGARLLCGGEALPPDLAAQLIAHGTLHNVYGPTETTVWSSIAALAADHPAPVLGAPLRNTTLHVLDGCLQPVPLGVAGELYIGGDGLARGYAHRPQLTAERFVPDPFRPGGGRLYRTGDRVRRRRDGALEYLGRVDHQVKLRGHRIELGEIEAQLLADPRVRAAAVVLREDAPGQPRIVGYLVPATGAIDATGPGAHEPAGSPALDAAVLCQSLRAQLAAVLPDIMVPSQLVALVALPRSPAGKLDRKALPAPEASDTADAYVAPRDALEQRLARIWQDALGRDRVGATDRFFDLGGHSLLAARVTSRILAELGVAVPLRALFETPELGGFADRVRGLLDAPHAAPPPPIPRADRDRPLPLSFAQERQWFLWRLEPASSAYHMPAAIELTGRLDAPRLEAALTALAARHEVLRTRFAPSADTVHQVIDAPAAIQLPVAPLDRAALAAEATRPFDLERGPLWRARLYRIDDARHVLLVVLHHAIGDEASMHAMLDEVCALYARLGRGEAPDPAPAIQYADYAAWQRGWLTGAELERQLAYWRRQLGTDRRSPIAGGGDPDGFAGGAGGSAPRGIDHPVLELPADRARPAVPSGRGAAIELAIDPELTRALRRLAHDRGATLFMVLLAAFDVLLHRVTGQRDLRVGVPSANRGRLELESLIGLFVNTHVLRTELAPSDRFAAVLARVRDAALGAQAHAELPFEQLVEALNPPRSLSHSPLFQVLFNHIEAGAAPPATGELAIAPWDLARPTAQFELSVDTALTGDALAMSWGFATDAFDAATIERLAASYRRLLAAIAAAPDARIDLLPLVSDDELAVMTREWNATWRDHGLDGSLGSGFAERFAARAADAPGRVAARHRGVAITRGALAARAHRVARALHRRGVRPGDPVAVLAERGLDHLGFVTGILAAGAAYVALDVRHPDDRIRHSLCTSGARAVLVTTPPGAPTQRAGDVPVVTLADCAGEPDAPLGLPSHPDQLAYVLYTSGSTGAPKGAMVTLAGMLNNLLGKVPALELSEQDVIAQTAAPSFDISVWQMLTGLLCGAVVDIVPDDIAGDPRALLDHVRAAGITVLEAVPALIHELVRQPPGALPLRVLLPTGEALTPELARLWLVRYPDIPLVNAYGPAECADDVALCRIATPPPADALRMPIGRPTDNTQLFVLDTSLRPVPVGVVGQLAVAGVGVGRGYAADPPRTAAVFVPHPLGRPGERMYLTGDLARHRPDGTLEYVGRADHQVKLRGHRIELGEIEARLVEQAGVAGAAVALRTDGGEPRLVGYVVIDGAAIDPATLRARLAEVLPEIMVPSHIVALDALPRTANGKLDRNALPAPVIAAAQRVAPRTPLEAQLARIWADVLGVPEVGLDDHFFDLGGHSLLATRLTSRLLDELRAEVALRAIFEAPRLVDFAAHVRAAIAGGAVTAAPITPVDRSRPLPLSFAQERLWFLWRLEPDSAAYHIPMVARLAGALDLDAMRAALAGLADRHAGLRTRFVESSPSEVAQVIEPRLAPEITAVDLRGDADRQRRVDDAIAGLLARPFDLTCGPLWRAALYQTEPDQHVLAVVLHHAIADEVSLRVLIDELAELYAAHRDGRAPALAPLAVEYADFAAWQRVYLAGDELARQLAYWRAHLGDDRRSRIAGDGDPDGFAGGAGGSAPRGIDHPVIELPTDRPRPAIASGRGGLALFALDAALGARLHRLARDRGATLFMVLLAAFDALLYRITGHTDLRVGVPSANRNRVEIERVIGLFVNTHVLRTEIDPAASFVSLLARVKDAALGAQAHQDLPFEQLVEALNPPRSLSTSPLFQVMFNFLWTERDRSTALPGLRIEPVDHERTTTQFDLALDTWEEAGAIHGALTYAADLFDADTAARLTALYGQLLRAIAERPDAPVATLPLLDAAERDRLLVAQAFGPAEPRDPRCVHEVVRDHIVRTPDAVAVRHAGSDLRYAELGARADRLERRLRRLGVPTDTLVGVCLERTHHLVPSALGVLQAGCGYLPLDPDYPRDRIAYMLRDARPAVVVTEPHLAERFGDEIRAAGAALCLVDGDDAPPPERTGRPSPGHIAYCIYTSGSTGRPKGALIPHAALVSHLASMRAQLAVTPADRMLAIAPFSFDISALEIFLPLTTGACVVLADRATARDPAALLARVREDRVGIVQGTPATWRMVVSDPRAAETLASVRMLSGGEYMPPDLARQLIAIAGGMCNSYGPTETTIYSSSGQLTVAQPDPVIGQPLAGTRYYVLDGFLQPVPIGVAGELYIGGVLLARGYWDRPALTAERFIPDPFGSGERLYRSGDVVRRRADGELEFLRRADHQIKLRGHRIELGEIEARVLATGAVRAAAVILREDAPGDPRLVAYVVPTAGPLDAARLSAELRDQLPEFMLPSAFVELPALPMTVNGKLDRRALPAPEVRDAAARHVAPRTPLETQLAGIWAQALGVERVGLDDDFFALGGHSLLATRLISRIRHELGVAVPLRALFDASELGGFARCVHALLGDGAPAGAPPIPRADRGLPLPLSFAQERQWFLWRLEPETTAYHVPVAVRLAGPLDVSRLEAAFTALAARHEVLRTRLVERGGEVHQVIDAAATLALAVEPLADPGALAAAVERELKQPFDLERGPLWRARLYRIDADHHALVIVFHHAISDEQSIRVAIDELGRRYAGEQIAPLAVDYADHAAWQRDWLTGPELERQLAYWIGQLGGNPPVIELPADRPRPAVASARGASVELRLPADVTRGLDRIARSCGATRFMVLLAGLAAWLHRVTGQTDLRVGVPHANRGRVELERMLGMFVNTHVLRAEVDPARGFIALVAQIKRTALDAQTHADLPFERLVHAIQPPRSLSHAPLFQVMFNHLTEHRERPAAIGDLRLEPVDLPRTTTQFDLSLTTWEDGGRDGGEILGLISYATDLFDESTVARFVAQLTRLLASITAAPDAPIGALELLSAGERRALTGLATGVFEPLDPRGLFDRVAAQAVRTPDAVAVQHAGATVSYAELDRRARRLAARLSRLGVGRDDLVGLCVDRSPRLVVAALGILAAGGAYVPLDPDYPRDRLAYMLADARPRVLVTERPLAEQFADAARAAGAALCLLDDDDDDDPGAGDPALHPARPEQLAYCIYTSGSTGRPKGVGISHAAIGNFLDAMQRELPLTPADRVLAITPISFDIAGLELFLPLVAGARVVIADRDEAMDPTRLLARVRDDGVTLVQATPSTWRMVAGHPRAADSLRGARLLCGGEALPPDLAAALLGYAPLFNVYGPTETTVWSSIAALDADHPAPVLGAPLRNTTLHVLDGCLQPVPLGVAGELYIGGDGLARGYAHRPQLTAERFVPDPFRPGGGRLYRTGDRVRRRRDGALEYLGRVDHQVKLRGHRIELGEIEAQLLADPRVRAAAVVLREDAPGQPRIVGYLVPAAGAIDATGPGAHEPAGSPALDAAVLCQSLRAQLAAVLPDIMVPSQLVALDALPRSPAGKLDRKALPVPEAPRSAAPVPPRDDLERRLTALWEEVLGVPGVGIHDNFFDLGGHSLSATRLASRIRDELAVELPLRVLFESTTVAELADALRGETHGAISDAAVDAMADLLDALEDA